MSAHDYMSRSGYAEDAYPNHIEKFSTVDAEGKRWSVSGYGRSLGTHTYVTKVESCVQEIRKSKPAYSSSVTMGFPSKESGSFNNDCCPREVHDFISKILTEVNGPPRKTSNPNLGTNQGERNFPRELPARTNADNLEKVYVHEADQRHGLYEKSPVKLGPISGPPTRPKDPNWGRGWYSFPGEEEVRDSYGGGHRYGSPLTKAEPTMEYGHGYEYNTSPRKSERDPNHQWVQYSSPIYDHQPQGGYGVPNHQGDGYGLNPEAPRSPSPIHSHPPQKNYQLSDNKWGDPLKSQTRDFGAFDNQSPGKPSSFKAREFQNNERGSSLVKSHAPHAHGVPSDNTYALKPEKPNDRKIPDSHWGNPETAGYGVPRNKWDMSSSPTKDHSRDSPEKQLRGSIMNPKGCEVSGNQWDRSSSPPYNHPGKNPSSPKKQWGSFWVKTQSPKNHEVMSNQQSNSSTSVHNHPQNNPSSPENQWENSSAKTPGLKSYGFPSNQQAKSSTPVYNHPQNKSSSPKNHWESPSGIAPGLENYGFPSNQQAKSSTPVYNHPQNKSSSPKNHWESPSGIAPGLENYGFPSNQQAKSSTPVYSDPQNNPSRPKNQWKSPSGIAPGLENYGFLSNQQAKSSTPVYGHPQNNPSSPKNQWESSWEKTQGPKNYGVSSNHQSKSSPQVYDHPPNNPSSPKEQWRSSLATTESPGNYGVPSNQPSKSSIPVYNHSHNTPSGLKDQWRSSLVKIESPKDYGAPVNEQGRSSSLVHDHLRNSPSGPKDSWGSSPAKTQSPKGYGYSSNQWDRPLSPGYDHPSNDEQYEPPQVTCKDGVCTMNNKPKGPQRAYDEPDSNTSRFPETKPVSYPDGQYGTVGLRPYNLDHQPKDFGRSTNEMKPSGYNFGEPLEQLHLVAGTPTEGGAAAAGGKSPAPVAGIRGSQTLSVPSLVGPIRKTMGPRDIDSEEAMRRYGGCCIPLPGKP